MAAPQMSDLHYPSLTHMESSPPSQPPPLPPQTTTTTTQQFQESPHHHHHSYRPEPQPYPQNHTPIPPEGEGSQPLDLSVARRILPLETKRSAEADGSEERCVKHARVDVLGNSYAPLVYATSPGSQASVPSSPYGYYGHNHCSLPYYYPHHASGREKEKDGPSHSQHFPSSSSSSAASASSASVDNGLLPYYHTQENPGQNPGRGLYGSESAVSSSDVKTPEASPPSSYASSTAGICLGLPIPHSSVFSRSVSPLFQQSWHHSPISVSSHSHYTLLHPAAGTSVSPHLHPDLFPPPMSSSSSSSSSSVDQHQGLLSSPISASLHEGHGDLLRHPGSLSAYSQQSGFPCVPQEVLPNLGQGVLPTSGQSGLPIPVQGLLPSHGQSLLSYSRQNLVPSPNQNLRLFPAPGQNLLPSPGQNLVPSPTARQNMLPSPSQSQVPSPQQNALLSLPKTDAPPCPPHSTASASQEALPQRSTPSQHDPRSSPQEPCKNPTPPSVQTLPQISGVSPRPFYRPFEDSVKPLVQVSSPAAPARVEGGEYRSHYDPPSSTSASASFATTSVSMDSSDDAFPNSSTNTQQRKTGEGERGADAAVFSQNEVKDKHKRIHKSSSPTSHSGLAHFSGQSKDRLLPRETYVKPAKSSTSTRRLEADCSSSSNSNSSAKAKSSPIQDNAILSSTSNSLNPLFSSSLRGTGRKPEAEPIKIVGTTRLAKIREDRAKQEAKAREERLREFIARRQEYRSNDGQGGGGGGNPVGVNNNNDCEASFKTDNTTTDGGWISGFSQTNGADEKKRSVRTNVDEGGSEHPACNSNSDEKAVPGSSQGDVSSQSSEGTLDGPRGSQNSGRSPCQGASPEPNTNTATTTTTTSLGEGSSVTYTDLPSSSSSPDHPGKNRSPNTAPIPPDPNLKISPLDYLISKVLVEKIDVPFKPENQEIRAIYTGAKKGRLTLVDLIELQVEASLKA
ncbi:hypothetical protein ACOMHN_023205 [Nucella lapillus]